MQLNRGNFLNSKKIKRIQFKNRKNNRLLIVGDIHGCYDLLCRMLEKINYDPSTDKLVFLGDYIDRGPNSKKVVELTKTLVQKGAIALVGNHEDMALKYTNLILNDVGYDPGFKYNGGRQTLESYNKNIERLHEDLLWLNDQPVVCHTNKILCVHAGLKPKQSLHKQSKKDLLWIRKEFIEVSGELIKDERTIIVGHTSFQEPQFLGKKIIIDTGAGKGGYLTCLDLTNGLIYKTI